MRELVETVARALVTRPEEVSVTESEEGGAVALELALSPEDLGRVIGREGRTARALRAFAAAAGRKRNQRVLVRIRG
ncbi:MAG TPA: KH domain-containing protein [Thermoanaerobaculia bacterium]|nr:KH domain-containing protein [Thermoanaerobaculia bacterium]